MKQWYRSIRGQIQRTLQLKRAVLLVWESTPRWTIISIFTLLAQGLLPIAAIYLMKLMLDAVSEAMQAGDPIAAYRDVLVVIGIAGIVALLTNLARTIGTLVGSIQGRIVVDKMYDVLHAKSIEVDLEYYENAQYYDTLHRAQQEVTYRPIMIVNGLISVAQNTISLVGVAWLLLSFHWSVLAILIVTVIPGMLIRLRFSSRMYQLQRQYTPDERQAWYFHQMLTSPEHAKEIRLFTLGGIFTQRYQGLRGMLRAVRMRIDVERSGWEFAAQALATLAVFGSYALIAYQTLQGNHTLGDLVMFYQAFQRGQTFLQDLLGGLAELYENNLFITNFYEFLDLERTIKEPANPQSVPRPIQEGITFNDISFQYPGSNREALHNIDLTINPGEVIALVGENGSGKTTLIKLLCRLYDPNDGSIRIDGQDIRDFTTQDLRREISVIFQDYAHYNLSARENIWFGNVELPADSVDVHAAAEHSGAGAVIDRLPAGYDTILGKLFDQGEELSIGQWQKIALARAFLRDSQLIVLDEPTSAMDPKAEFEVFSKFRELLHGKSAILISHRLSTVKMADRIYVLHQGRIIESGTHDQLVQNQGAYAHLFETQAQYYR